MGGGNRSATLPFHPLFCRCVATSLASVMPGTAAGTVPLHVLCCFVFGRERKKKMANTPQSSGVFPPGGKGVFFETTSPGGKLKYQGRKVVLKIKQRSILFSFLRCYPGGKVKYRGGQLPRGMSKNSWWSAHTEDKCKTKRKTIPKV